MSRGERRSSFWFTVPTVITVVMTLLFIPLSLDFPIQPALNFESKAHLHEAIHASPLLIAGQRAVIFTRKGFDIGFHVMGLPACSSDYLDGRAIVDPFNHLRFRILYSRISAADL